MKFNGKKLDKPNEAFVVIPRHDGDMVFKAQAVLDYQVFDDLCPRPVAPIKIHRVGGEQSDITDKTYLEQLDIYSRRRVDFMILKSLEATEFLEWETVDMNNPETWSNYDKELADSSLTDREVDHVLGIVFEANGLSEDKINEARERFLSQQAQAKEKVDQNTQTVAQQSSTSGGHVKDSE